jgi:plasmid stability protein
MSTLTIRNIESEIKDKLRLAAAAHGRSMEEEVRSILRSVLSQPAAAPGLGSRLHARFAAIGGVDLPLPERTEPARAADFGDAERGDTETPRKVHWVPICTLHNGNIFCRLHSPQFLVDLAAIQNLY